MLGKRGINEGRCGGMRRCWLGVREFGDLVVVVSSIRSGYESFAL